MIVMYLGGCSLSWPAVAAVPVMIVDNPVTPSIDWHAEQISIRGYTVIENVLDPEQTRHAGAELDQIFAQERQNVSERHNDTHDLSYMLPFKSEIFRSIAQVPYILCLMRALLGHDCVLSSFNGLSIISGSEGQKLHLDHQGLSTAIITLNVVFVLDPFTRENGCTRIVPFTHKNRVHYQDVHPRFGKAFDLLESEVMYAEAAPGSAIVYSGDIVHAGSKNSTSAPRRALHAFYCRRWVRPVWDFPNSLPAEFAKTLTAGELSLFGFRCQPKIYSG